MQRFRVARCFSPRRSILERGLKHRVTGLMPKSPAFEVFVIIQS